MTAHRLFKYGHRRRRDVGLCIALLAVLALFGFTRPGPPHPVQVADDHPLQVVILPTDPTVPPPPPVVPHPVVSDEPVADVLTEEESFNSTFDPNELTASLPVPARTRSFQAYDRAPRPRTMVAPEYPAIAREAGIEGRVVCQVAVDENGRTIGVLILHSDADVFDRSVVDALFQWTWFPAEQSDRPVPATVVVPYEFRLKN